MIKMQNTIAREISCSGIGIHSGLTVTMKILPAPVDTGIVFRRMDVNNPEAREVHALYDQVVDTMMGTTIANAQATKISTIEHFMSAVAASDIDNLIIELSAHEMPIMDGSAEPFVFLLAGAGIAEQDKPRASIEITDTVEFHDGESWIKVVPDSTFSVDLTIDFARCKAIGKQHYCFNQDLDNYETDISRARTFGFYEDVEKLKAAGLGLGGSLENAVILKGDEILNPDGLRFPDEFVRHKMMDFIGDMFTSGHHFIGKFTAYKPGHTIHNKFLRELLLNQTQCWQLTRGN